MKNRITTNTSNTSNSAITSNAPGITVSIQAERLRNQLLTLGSIGFEEGKGTTRQSYTAAYEEGRAYVERLMREAGLETSLDAVGNLTGSLAGSLHGAKIISIGSHIDTVKYGGMYDGAYGVLAAVEGLRSLRGSGWRSRHPIEVIAFIEEEGNVVGGTFGSKAFSGVRIEPAEARAAAVRGMDAQRIESCRRNRQDYACYLELHIEQGGILDSEAVEIGIAEGIVGILRYEAAVAGEANHAGSTPMRLRRDALRGACEVILDLMSRAEAAGDTIVCTVGRISVMPGEVNVIPGRADFVIELRGPSLETLRQLAEELEEDHRRDGLTLSELLCQPPTLCDGEIMRAAEQCADRLGLSRLRLFSGAGHDLINMGKFTRSALLFIPSVGGISHSPEEYSRSEDLEKGARLLAELIKELDEKEDCFGNGKE